MARLLHSKSQKMRFVYGTSIHFDFWRNFGNLKFFLKFSIFRKPIGESEKFIDLGFQNYPNKTKCTPEPWKNMALIFWYLKRLSNNKVWKSCTSKGCEVQYFDTLLWPCFLRYQKINTIFFLWPKCTFCLIEEKN